LKNQLIILEYIDLHLCVVDYYLCNELNWYSYVLIWVITLEPKNFITSVIPPLLNEFLALSA